MSNSVLRFAGNNCNDCVLELPESPYSVTLMTTVVSKPAVRILIEGNEVNQSSISLNPDCPDVVTTSISERCETSISDPTIHVTFEYNGLASEVCILVTFQEEGMLFDFVLEIYIIITRSTWKAQTSLAEADHYSHIVHCKHIEPWW